MTTRERADRLLVARGLFESRARAQAAIAAGLVTADGVPVRKASDAISSAAAIEAKPAHPYVSRGGVKLAAALDHFQLDVADRVCLDVGASTGGFTEVLLARGARRVYAIDVGSGQLHPRCAAAPRSCRWKKPTSARSMPARLPERPDFATVDVSFISLKWCCRRSETCSQPRATLVALIKPQFEAAAPRHQERHHARCGGA